MYIYFCKLEQLKLNDGRGSTRAAQAAQLLPTCKSLLAIVIVLISSTVGLHMK